MKVSNVIGPCAASMSRGSYSIVIEKAEPDGIGALAVRL